MGPHKAAAGQPDILTARGISKRFGGTQALRGVDFDLAAGEVHALVGANGAGKSTFARTIAGLHRPDSGTIRVAGEERQFAAPREAMDAGVTLVTQETSLAPHLTALENIFLPEFGNPGRLRWGVLRRRADDLIDELNMDVRFSLDDEVWRLSMANRQIVEIIKVLAINSKVIFLDEPTTSLSPFECDRLLEICRRLAAKGHGLVIVTHRMEEIFSFSDRLTVLREGSLVKANLDASATTPDELIRLMVGRELGDVYAHHQPAVSGARKTMFRVDHLASGNAVKDVSFSVAEGEILGLGGLVGAGRSESVDAIFGLSGHEAGSMELDGRPFRPSSPKHAIRAGIGYVGEDRRRHGLIPDLNVMENLLLVHLSTQRGFGLNYGSVIPEATSIVEGLGLAAHRLADPDILKYSGGMQQKIIMARWLLSKPRLLILDEPTRGVDIETRSSIYRSLRQIAADGTAIIVISSDFEELLGISNRIVVISDGRDVADVPSAYLDIERLTMLAAPRTSAGQIGNLLAELAERYGGAALWVHKDGERLFCFDCASPVPLPEGIRRGSLIDPAVPGAPCEDAAWAWATIRGKRGQSLGNLAVNAPEGNRLPSKTELEAAIEQALHPQMNVA